MSNKYSEPDESKTIFLVRWRECPKCHHYGKHRYAAHPQEDVWICENPSCGYTERIPVFTGRGEFRGMTEEDRERARRNVMNVVGDIQTHKWSKNLGLKDRSFIQRIIDRLIGIGRDLEP